MKMILCDKWKLSVRTTRAFRWVDAHIGMSALFIDAFLDSSFMGDAVLQCHSLCHSTETNIKKAFNDGDVLIYSECVNASAIDIVR